MDQNLQTDRFLFLPFLVKEFKENGMTLKSDKSERYHIFRNWLEEREIEVEGEKNTDVILKM